MKIFAFQGREDTFYFAARTLHGIIGKIPNIKDKFYSSRLQLVFLNLRLKEIYLRHQDSST